VTVSLSFLLVSFIFLFAGLLVLRTLRARGRARGRVIEQPNSHYTPSAARGLASRQRWRGIQLDRVHEVNRGEVTQLLAKAEANGADALRPAEQTFLDAMVWLAGVDDADLTGANPALPATPEPA
jgi:hypothetical protein